MHRQEVLTLDAVVAVSLVECSMGAAALVSADNALLAAFPENPMLQYKCQGMCSFCEAYTYLDNLIIIIPCF